MAKFSRQLKKTLRYILADFVYGAIAMTRYNLVTSKNLSEITMQFFLRLRASLQEKGYTYQYLQKTLTWFDSGVAGLQ